MVTDPSTDPHSDPALLIRDTIPTQGFSLSPLGRIVAFTRKTPAGSGLFLSSIDDFRPVALVDTEASCGLPEWSPDGREIAFVSYGDNGPELRAITIKDKRQRTIARFLEGSVGSLQWSRSGEYIAFTSSHRGTLDLYVIKHDGTGLLRLTSGPERDFQPRWSPDDRTILFFSLMRPAGGPWEMRTIKSDGTGLRRTGPDAERNAHGAWSPDGSAIAFHSNACGSYRIGLMDTDSEQVEWLTPDDRDSWTPVWMPEGKRIACTLSERGNTRPAIIDAGTGRVTLFGPRAGLCSNVRVTCDGRTLLFLHDGPRNPPELRKQELSGEEASARLTNSLPASVDRSLLVIPEEVSYESFDGLEINSLLYRPPARDGIKPPAIIRLHGGPNYQTYNCWQPMIQFMVSHGYLILAPDYRGSTGYGTDFENLSRGDWGGGDLKDVTAAAEWLTATGQAHPDRIALLGGSYGGYLTLMAMAHAPDKWAAGVDLFGFADLTAFHEEAAEWMRKWIEDQIGSPEDNRSFYRQRSPITHCDRITSPLLMLHGASDRRVPLSQAEQLKEIMERNGRECRLKVYGSGDHFFGSDDTRTDTMKTILEFLNTHLKENGDELS